MAVSSAQAVRAISLPVLPSEKASAPKAKQTSKDSMRSAAETGLCSRISAAFLSFVAAVAAKCRAIFRSICGCCLSKKAPPKVAEKPKMDRAPYLFAESPENTARKVTDGYGELILRVREGGTLRTVTKEEYAQAYKIFQKHVPRLDAGAPLNKSRITLMREELKTLNPNIVATFVPRTLYELFFIRASIEEDLEKVRQAPDKDNASLCYVSKNSWCKVPFNAKDLMLTLKIRTPEDVDKNFDRLMEIGTRLNEAACRVLTNDEDLSLGQIQGLVNREVQFLSDINKDPRYQGIPQMNEPGPSTLFITTSYRGGLKPMAVNSKQIAEVIRRAADLECRPGSANKVILYRGSDLDRDSADHNGRPHTLSYGAGLFAGVVNDGGATAFYYMREKGCDAHALVADPKEGNSELVYVPRHTALEGFFGDGEAWHIRTRAFRSKGIDAERTPSGFQASSVGLSSSGKYDFIRSRLPREQFLESFDAMHKRSLVVFKPKED